MQEFPLWLSRTVTAMALVIAVQRVRAWLGNFSMLAKKKKEKKERNSVKIHKIKSVCGGGWDSGVRGDFSLTFHHTSFNILNDGTV